MKQGLKDTKASDLPLDSDPHTSIPKPFSRHLGLPKATFISRLNASLVEAAVSCVITSMTLQDLAGYRTTVAAVTAAVGKILHSLGQSGRA